jgi:hypothetical protein
MMQRQVLATGGKGLSEFRRGLFSSSPVRPTIRYPKGLPDYRRTFTPNIQK